jgi:hypothetical protein
MVFTHVALDDFGDPLKRFKSKREADWFAEVNPGIRIKSTGCRPPPKIPEPDPYSLALDQCGIAPF